MLFSNGLKGAYHGIPICLLFPRRFVSGSLSLNIYYFKSKTMILFCMIEGRK